MPDWFAPAGHFCIQTAALEAKTNGSAQAI